jgi:hypothetical protein
VSNFKIEFKKYLIAILILLMIISISFIYINKITFQKYIEYSTLSSNIKVHFRIPSFKHRIHIDMHGLDKSCQQYIKLKNIYSTIYYNNISIDINQLNKLSYNKQVFYTISFDGNLDKCHFGLMIFDPYGNLLKILFLFIFPLLTLLYLLFKASWLIIAEFKRE